MPESTGRGALTEAVYYILLSLTKPLHGYGIMQYVSELSHDRVKLGAGTLYGAINTLLEKGWICTVAQESTSRKKEYVLTQTGRDVLEGELKRLRELLENGEKILNERNGGIQNGE